MAKETPNFKKGANVLTPKGEKGVVVGKRESTIGFFYEVNVGGSGKDKIIKSFRPAALAAR